LGVSSHGDRAPASNPGGPDPRVPQTVLDAAPLPDPKSGIGANAMRDFNAGGPAEMRFNLKTDAFGRVEMHTIVHGNQVGLSLASERGDLRGALAAESVQLDASLRQHDLRLHELRFLGHGAGLANSGSCSDRGSQEQRRPLSAGRDTALRRIESDSSLGGSGAGPLASDIAPTYPRKGGLSLHV